MKFAWTLFKSFPAIITLLVIGLVMQLAACAGAADRINKIAGTSDAINAAKNTTKNQGKTLKDMKGTVDGLTPQNVPNQKPLLQGQVKTATDQNGQIADDLNKAGKSAKQDEQTIASAGDPVKERLQWFAYGAIVLGIVAVVAGFFFSKQLGTIGDYIRSGGGASIVVGVLTLAVVYIVIPFLHALFWVASVLVAVGLAGALVWGYLHRNQIVPTVESWFGKATAAVKKDVA